MAEADEDCPKGGKHNYHETEGSMRDFSGETWKCTKCGDSYYLDYEDMK